MNKMCSKKMVKALPLWIGFYQGCSKQDKELLLSMSASTIDRLLKPYKTNSKKVKGLGSTDPSLLKNKIPIKLLDANITEPGFIEADTVAHCGGSLAGTFAYSLTMTDLFSGWTENRACLSKGSDPVKQSINYIEKRLPFGLQGFACDNGSEFLTHDLHKYFTGRDNKVEFVRRRAYKKNDNAHVEQKNFTHVRELFGYDRIEDPELIRRMNEIYTAYWNPLWNFFTPSMKLIEKTRVKSRIKKKYDEPQTPYQRLMASDKLTLQERQDLKTRFEGLNPFYLKSELDHKLKILFKLVERAKKESLSTG